VLIVWILLAVVVVGIALAAWMGFSLLALAHRIAEPRERPRRRHDDPPPPPAS
jgi:hypothetical protein